MRLSTVGRTALMLVLLALSSGAAVSSAVLHLTDSYPRFRMPGTSFSAVKLNKLAKVQTSGCVPHIGMRTNAWNLCLLNSKW